MSTFIEYLTESTKSYDFKIKVAGDLEKDFANRMEGALKKFDIQKMSAGKSTPIQSLPLDFPNLKNEAVTIYDVTTAYPASAREMKEYLADYMNVNPAMMKNKEEIEYAQKPKVEQEIQSKEEKATPSPFTKTTNPHPDPARK